MPVAWFFTSRDGTIKRKARYNVTLEQILDAFLTKSAKRSGCDIVATFVDTSSGGGTVGAGPLASAEAAEGGATGGGAGGSRPTITYMNEESLKSFLGNSRRPYSGVLYLFIGPKSPYNTVMRCVWAPKLCVSERRVNTRKLKDRRAGIFERAVTFEGEPHNSDSAAVRGSVLPKQLQGLSESVVFHVAQVSRLKARVSRLVADFKLDPDDRLWLLRVVSLRLEGESIDRSDPAVLSGAAVDVGRGSGVGGFGARTRGLAGPEGGADDGVIFPHRTRKDGVPHPMQAAMSGLKKPASLLGPVSLEGGIRVPATALPALNGVSSVLAPGMQAAGSVLGPPLVPEGEDEAAVAAGAGAGAAGGAGADSEAGGAGGGDGSITGTDPFRVQSSTLRGVRPQSRQSLLVSQILGNNGGDGDESGFPAGALGIGSGGAAGAAYPSMRRRRGRASSSSGVGSGSGGGAGTGAGTGAEQSYLRPAVEVPELTPAKLRLMRKAHALEAKRQGLDPESTMPAALVGHEAADAAVVVREHRRTIGKRDSPQRQSQLQKTRQWVDEEMGLTGSRAAKTHAMAGVLEAAARNVTEALPEAALQATNGMLVLREGQCPSCGAAMSQSLPASSAGGDAGGCPVPYKTVISHYDAVLQELGLRGITTHEMEDYDHDVQLVTSGRVRPEQAFDTLPVDVVLWPQQKLSRAAAGGVGMYGVWTSVEYLRAAALSQEAKRKKKQMERKREARRQAEMKKQRQLEREEAGLPPFDSDEEKEEDGEEEPEDIDEDLAGAPDRESRRGSVGRRGSEHDWTARIDMQPDVGGGFKGGESTGVHGGGERGDEEDDGELSLAAIGEGGRLGRPPVKEVPPVLRLLHPKMGPAEYRWMRSDPLFMFRTARVCEACFLVYAQFSQHTVSGKAPHFALRQIMGPKVRKMVDSRDVGEAMEDGKRQAIEDMERQEEEDEAKRAKGRPIFKVGASGSYLSFHSSQRKEEEEKQGDSIMLATGIGAGSGGSRRGSVGRRASVGSQRQAGGSLGGRYSHARATSKGGGQPSPTANRSRRGSGGRAVTATSTTASQAPEDGFRQFLGEQGFSETGPGLPPSLRAGGPAPAGAAPSILEPPRTASGAIGGAASSSSGSFMRAVAADPELHSGHPLAFMSATGTLPARRGGGGPDPARVRASTVAGAPGTGLYGPGSGGGQAWYTVGADGMGARRASAHGGSLPALPYAPLMSSPTSSYGPGYQQQRQLADAEAQSRSHARLAPLRQSPTSSTVYRPFTGAGSQTSAPGGSTMHGGGPSQGSIGLASINSGMLGRSQGRGTNRRSGGTAGSKSRGKGKAASGSGRPKPSPFAQIQHLPGDKPMDPTQARARRAAASARAARRARKPDGESADVRSGTAGNDTKRHHQARADTRSQVLPLTTKYGEQYDPQQAESTGRGAGKSRGGMSRRSGGSAGDGLDAGSHQDFLARMRSTVSSEQAMADRADALAEVLGYEKTQDEAARKIQQGLLQANKGKGKGSAKGSGSGRPTGAAYEDDWRDQSERATDAYRQREATGAAQREEELKGKAAQQELRERARKAADVAAGRQPRPTELERELRREDARREALEQRAREQEEGQAARKRVEQRQREQARKDGAEAAARDDVDAEEGAAALGDGAIAGASDGLPPQAKSGTSTRIPPGGPWLTDAGPGRVFSPKGPGGVLSVVAREEVIGRKVRGAASEGRPADQDLLGGVAREPLESAGAEPVGKEQAAWKDEPVFPELPTQRRVVSVLRRCLPGEFKPSEEDRRRARVARRREQQGLAVEPWELDEKASGGFVVLRRDLWTGAVWRSFWREGAVIDCGPAEMAREQARKEALAKAEEDPEGEAALASIMGSDIKAAEVQRAAEEAASALDLPELLPTDPLIVAASRRLQEWGGSALVESGGGSGGDAAPLPAQTMLAVGRASASSAVVQVDESLGTSASPLPGHWGAVVAHSMCVAPATESAAASTGIRRELCMLTVEVLPPDQSANQGGGAGRQGDPSMRVGFSPHASSSAVERLAKSVGRPRFCLRVLGVETGAVEVIYPLTLAELFRHPRLAGGSTALHDDPGGRAARLLASRGLRAAQERSLKDAETEARARAIRLAKERGDEEPDEEETQVPREKLEEIRDVSRRSPDAALLALTQAAGAAGGRVQRTMPAPPSGWQLWTGVLAPARRFGATLLLQSAGEADAVDVFPGRVQGASHSGWEGLEAAGAASGAGASHSGASVRLGGVTVSRPLLASLRSAAEKIGVDLKKVAKPEDLESLEDEEAREQAREQEVRARASAASSAPDAGDKAVAAMSDSLHAAGTLAARVMLLNGRRYQHVSVRTDPAAKEPTLSMVVRQSVSESGSAGTGTVADSQGSASAAPLPAGVATLTMPLTWRQAADPGHNPLLRRAAFELAEGFGFPTNVRPDEPTAVEDAAVEARRRAGDLEGQLAVAHAEGDRERSSRLERDLKEAREQAEHPEVATGAALPTAIPVACQVRELPAGTLFLGCYLSAPAGARELDQGTNEAARERQGDPAKAKTDVSGRGESESEGKGNGRGGSGKQPRLVVIVARLPSGGASPGFTLSEKMQKPVRMVFDLDRARDGRANPLLERAKPHVTGVRRETDAEARVRERRDADKAGASMDTRAAGDKAAAAVLG